MKKKKEKKHKHKWEQQSADCPFCGGGDYVDCECGEMKRIVYLGEGKSRIIKF